MGDDIIIVWDNKLNPVNKINIKTTEVNSMNYKIRSICTNDEGDILIGTRSGEILKIKDNKPRVCLRGHFDGNYWAKYPSQKRYYLVYGKSKLKNYY